MLVGLVQPKKQVSPFELHLHVGFSQLIIIDPTVELGLIMLCCGLRMDTSF